MKIAIIAVAYNRSDSLGRLLKSLERATYPESATLIISIDKSKTDAVEKMADGYHWPYGELRVVKHEKNLGLRAHMLSLGNYFQEYDALIVLEDDVTVATSFYYYAKACIEEYFDDSRIAGISLYNFPVNYQTWLPFIPAKSRYDVYMMNCAQSWGEVWMRPQWEAFKRWYEDHSEAFSLDYLPQSLNKWPPSSWLKYHTRYCIEEDKYFVYPYYSMTTNNADLGTNFQEKVETVFQANLQVMLQTRFLLPESTADDVILYDGFFQNKRMGQYLGVMDDELCVDLFSNKPVCLFRRCLLSNRSLPYNVIKSFALQFRPLEMNIINQCEGNELFLYDTTQKATQPKKADGYLVYAYFYQKGLEMIRSTIGVCHVASIITYRVFMNLRKGMLKK